MTEGLEDYLEAILICEERKKYVRTKHLADMLGVKSPSVNAAIKELEKLGLVMHESYGYIELTTQGRRKAGHVYSRHKLLYRFFTRTLDLPSGLAEEAACGIEHHLDSKVLVSLSRFLDYVEAKMKDHDFSSGLKAALENG